MATETFPISEFTPLDLAFGPNKVEEHMPKYDDIPSEFRRGQTKWNELFNEMFFSGISDLQLTPKEGIDKDKAWRHLRAISGSFASKHEHKEAAFAYLASQWFADVKWKKADKKK